MNSKARRQRLAALVVIVAAASGWRLFHARTAPALVAGGRAEIVAPHWHLGRVDLQPCEVGNHIVAATMTAWCAEFPVAEDHGATGGRQITLHMAILRSDAAKPASDLLVYLAGGPGAAATDDFSGVAPAFAELRAHRHVLLIDQRGTGRSNALSCKTPDGKGDAFVGQSAADEAEHIDRIVLHRQLTECLARLAGRADPRFYTSGDAVADLESVRQALGAPLLDLVGVSYGTRMAQQYAASHPAAVRSIVLDSAVPNTLVLGSEHAVNMESALKARFEVCEANPECARRFGDPYASLQQLRHQLAAKPVVVSGRDPLDGSPVTQRFGVGDLAVGVRLFAYSPASAALLPLAVSEALRGNFQPLLGQEQLITKGVAEQLADGMGLSIACAEDADLLQPRPQDADTLMGTSIIEYTLASCEVWPKGHRRADFHTPLATAAPTLVLAGELDPVTPARYGQQIVAPLANARLLIFKGQGHGVMMIGCAPRLLREFIEKLQPKALGAQCLEALGDTPAYLDFSGAAP